MSFHEKSKRVRLDQLLVEQGHFTSRSRARDAVARGTVRIDGTVVSKASLSTPEDAKIEINDPAQTYVSRAALKLVAALEAFGISADGADCLDIGASTGGFTQVLLENGAAHVVAIDVGHDQLHDTLRDKERVTALEGLNARHLEQSDLGDFQPTLIVSDVSFISLKLALPPALELAQSGAQCILLVKPQFEVGKEKVGKGGIVRHEDGLQAAEDLRQWLDGLEGWKTIKLMPSPIKGGDGNSEYLLAGIKE